MLFKAYHIPLIRTGEKTQTRREWSDDYHPPKPGTVVAATTALFVPDDEADCFIRILDLFDQPLGAMTDADARAEGDYESVAEFRNGYERVYGDGSWDPEKVVTVVEFEYVGRSQPAEDERAVRADGGQAVADALAALTPGDHVDLTLADRAEPVTAFVRDLAVDRDGLAGVAERQVTLETFSGETIHAVLQIPTRPDATVELSHVVMGDEPADREYVRIQAVDDSAQQTLADGGGQA